MKRGILLGLIFIFLFTGFVSAECSDSDSSVMDGLDPYTKGTSVGCLPDNSCGTFKDVCVDSKNRKEYFCVNGNLNVVEENCPFDTDCVEGVCEESISQKDYNCVDSDGGQDIHVKGSIQFEDDQGRINTFNDDCYSVDKVQEYDCEGLVIQTKEIPHIWDGYLELIDCPVGEKCGGGKCIECVENWVCTGWGTCTNNQQTKGCTDSNS